MEGVTKGLDAAMKSMDLEKVCWSFYSNWINSNFLSLTEEWILPLIYHCQKNRQIKECYQNFKCYYSKRSNQIYEAICEVCLMHYFMVADLKPSHLYL